MQFCFCRGRLFAAFLLCMTLFFSGKPAADIFADERFGFALDLPEGFAAAAEDGACSFRHTVFPVEAAVRFYDAGRFSNPDAAFDYAFSQLNASGPRDSFVWRGRACCIAAPFDMRISRASFRGMAFCCELPAEKGILFFTAYAPLSRYEQLAQFIASITDSIRIDRGSYFEAGPLTSYAFPPSGRKSVKLSVDGVSVDTSVDAADEEAALFVVEREHAVLAMFADGENWLPAWQRYYRLIYQDSYSRLKQAAFDIYAALSFADASGGAEKNDGGEARHVHKMLRWIQQMPYARDNAGTDFTPLPQALCGQASDCDSRSMLFAVLASHMNYRALMFVSPEYSHALAGIALEGSGARLSANGVSYLLCETTAAVRAGLVEASMTDSRKWIAVDFPE
ncbi:MAG: hypothetical protein NC041_10165 [Bacteroides sp.]|nr:hypothetical protein [Prevotella sp.]MCM1406854.1 hypothetical protein [Treponema brennaborense]MCM1470817.1 hypothetical protein [Bacteroides sp.]